MPVTAMEIFPGSFLASAISLAPGRDAERRRHRHEHRILGGEADRQEIARQLQRQIGRDRRQRTKVDSAGMNSV